MCFYTWGSYLPLDPTANYDPEFTRLRALDKINQSKRELRMLISDNEFLTNKIISDLIPKLTIIENGLQKIKQAMEKSNNIFPSTAYPQNTLQATTKDLSAREIQPKVQDPEAQVSELSKQLGYLLPLNCGHNGAFSNTEKHLYEGHLQRSGFI